MTINAPLDRSKLDLLTTDIEASINELKTLSSLEPGQFEDKKNYGLAEHYLRRALEGILTVGTHIVSRLPVKTKDYQEIILTLGRHGIVPTDFAEKNRKLAGYRNRLVHMYWEVGAKEMHRILNEHLPDLAAFVDYFKQVLLKPQDFGLALE